MALAHQLVVITRENPEENVWLDTERVFLSNLLFQYMKDSLMWVNTRWNGKKLTTGFTEGGFSVIDRREIEKFLHIMKRWEELFQCSPEEFYLTRRNSSREYRQKEGVLVRKKEVLEELNSCIYLCTKALKRGARILYSEI